MQGNVALEKSQRKKPFAWLPELGWEDAVHLAEVSPETFGSLLDDIEQNVSQWKQVGFPLYDQLLLHCDCALSCGAQCIVIAPVCGGRAGGVGLLPR